MSLPTTLAISASAANMRSMALWALVGAFCVSGCGLPKGDYFGKVDEDPDPTHLRWCNSGEPEWLDPALVTSTTGNPVAYAMFDGLTDHNLQGLPEKSLATHWDVSPDQRRFTFHLHDRGRWSNGRPVTAHDFAYHLMRVLHPLSFSRNAETLWKLKGGELYTKGRAKMLLRDAPPFRAGDVVEVLGVFDPAASKADGSEPIAKVEEIPDPNLRIAKVELFLRDRGAAPRQAYATVPPGQEVTIIDLDTTSGTELAYVHWADGNGVYGWVESQLLTGQPNGDVAYWVREVPKPHRVGLDVPADQITRELGAEQQRGSVRGTDLLALPDVLGVRVPSDYVLVIETWGPVPYLIDMTPQRAFRPTPIEAVSRWPLRWTDPDKIITSGAFHLHAWYERDRIELVKSKTFWDRDRIRLERLTAYSLADQAASTNYYMQGGCDAVCGNNIPASYLPALTGEKRGGKPYKDFTIAPILSNYFYLINTEKLSNVHLRRALNFAVDRRPIPRLLHGGEIPSAQFMPGTPIAELSEEDLALCGVTRDTPGVALIVTTGELCYVPPPGLEFDVEKAREELELAKKELAGDFPETLTIKFNTGFEGHKLIAEYLQQEWKEKLGLDIELTSQEWKTYLKSTTSGEYEIGRFGNVGNFPDPESEFLAIFKCGAPNNRTRWCNDEFMALFRKAESTADRTERLALIRQAEEVFIRESVTIPLYIYTQYHLQKPYVRDLAINLPNRPALSRAWIDPSWKERAKKE